MLGHFGFSYVGAIYLVMLFVPNIIWSKHQPVGYNSDTENRILLVFERIGEVVVTCTALIFSDFNIKLDSFWSLWLLISAIFMLLYKIYWIRYFRSQKMLEDFYSSLIGIPVAGATLPVISFLMLGIYGKNIWMLISVIILGIGHIGIHLGHKKQLNK
ncbi:hypothetical protein [Ruminococcus sp.]|uniref:hypothetical protein n=1 Tax=Ruminococcus sp. TaxID=41978 RepID=UPI0025D8AB0A|nr:hypothetical protein [Ruminococcus sp.]MCI6617053.1 hypothetical protein [Ruminococcus sp.]